MPLPCVDGLSHADDLLFQIMPRLCGLLGRLSFLAVTEGSSTMFDRITINAEQMGGVPCLRGLRIPVATVVGMVGEGISQAEILAEFPDLEQEDLQQALQFAARAVEERQLPLLTAA